MSKMKDKTQPCPRCDGSGEIRTTAHPVDVFEDCPVCDGHGYVPIAEIAR